MISCRSDDGGHTAVRGATPLLVFGLLVACAAVWIAQTRTYTYVSGQDPMTYMHLARQLLGTTPHDPVTSGKLVAPGHPALLAAVIALFGSLAPYWMNAVLAVIGVLLLWKLLTLLNMDRIGALASVLTTMLIVLAGHPNNVHFLLYPFRETSGLFVLGLALLLFVAGMRSDNFRAQAAFGAASAVLALLASAIRETALIGFGGILLYSVAVPSVRRSSWRVPATFCAVLAVSLAAVLLIAGHAALSAQWRVLPVLAGQYGLRGFVDRFMFNEHVMRTLLVSELGWPGLCLLATCLLAVRRQAMLVVTAAVPALGWHICHAIHEAHPRYALYALICLGVLAGAGIASLLGMLNRKRDDSPQGPSTALSVATILILCAAVLTEVYLTNPWGTRVRRRQMDEFKAVIARVPGASTVLLTGTDRYVLDAVFSHTSLQVMTPETLIPSALREKPVLTVRALNREASFHGGYRPYAGILAPAILAHYASVGMVLDDSGQPSVFSLGDGQYELVCSTPWTQTTYTTELAVKPGSENVVWLDFGYSPPKTERSVTVTLPNDEASSTTFAFGGKDMVPVLVPRSMTTSSVVRLVVESNEPFRDTPLFTIQREGEPASFFLDHRRSQSIHAWFKKGFGGQTPAEKYTATMFREGTIAIPVPPSDNNLRIELAFQIEAPILKSVPAIELSVEVNGHPSTNWVIRKEGASWQGASANVAPGADTAWVRLDTQSARRRDVLRLHRLLICYASSQTP